MEILSVGSKISGRDRERKKKKQHRCELHIADHIVQKREAEKHSQNTLEKIYVGKILIAECNVYYNARARYTQCDTMAIV